MKKLKLKLKIGKVYLTERGLSVKILKEIGCDGGGRPLFKGDSGYEYRLDGTCPGLEEDGDNLVKEATGWTDQVPDDDNVNHPSHYNRKGIEAIAAIEASMDREEFLGYLKGNVLKYVWRYKYKNGVEDLEKANWYMRKLIEEIKKNN